MTLIELMVGMTVGLFVVLVAVVIFISTRALHNVGASTTRMSENARLAMDLLESDLRNSSFTGCRPLLNSAPVSLLNPGTGAFLTGAFGLAGSHGDGASFSPVLSAPMSGLSAAAAPLPTSDVLSVRVTDDMQGLGVTQPMLATNSAPQLAPNSPGNTLATGDIVLVASCKAAAIFQVTEVLPIYTGILNHAVNGSFVPGNGSDDLQQRFRTDSTVYRLQTHHYFVAASALHPGANSLWRYVVPGPAEPAEIAIGVDRLLVTYGVDGSTAVGSQNADHYVTADAVTAWDRVISVRLQILLATANNNMASSTQTMNFAGAPFTPPDRRLRSEISAVVTVRSAAP